MCDAKGTLCVQSALQRADLVRCPYQLCQHVHLECLDVKSVWMVYRVRVWHSDYPA